MTTTVIVSVIMNKRVKLLLTFTIFLLVRGQIINNLDNLVDQEYDNSINPANMPIEEDEEMLNTSKDQKVKLTTEHNKIYVNKILYYGLIISTVFSTLILLFLLCINYLGSGDDKKEKNSNFIIKDTHDGQFQILKQIEENQKIQSERMDEYSKNIETLNRTVKRLSRTSSISIMRNNGTEVVLPIDANTSINITPDGTIQNNDDHFKPKKYEDCSLENYY